MNDNYEPFFYNVSNDWQERWDLIKEFTTRWHGIQFRDRTKLLPLVKQQENRLGFELPPSFREYIMFSADANGIVNNQIVKVIRDDYTVEYLKNLSAVSLLRLSEGDAFWAVKTDNLTQVDPLVETYILNDIGSNLYDDYALSRLIKEEGFKYAGCDNQSITDFVFDSIVFFLNSKRGSYVQFRDINSEFIVKIKNTFQKKSMWGSITIYEMQNIIAILNSDKTELTVRLWKKLSQEEIPDFLFGYKPSGGQYSADDNIFGL